MTPTVDTPDLVRAVLRTVRRTPRGRMGQALRSVLSTFGPVVPMGDGDSKTDSPGTYRRVGPACPTTCPLLPVHATGTGLVDWSYVDALAALCAEYARQTRRTPDAGPLAWTYTHEEDPATVEELRRRLPWIAIRHSDHDGHGGAIVLPFERVSELRKVGLSPLKCPAQRVEGVTCATCRACWEQPQRLIVFDPHGGGERKLRRALETGTDADGTCYATQGNVALHQRRATGASWAAARTALGAIAWAAATGLLARLHVSGDFHGGQVS